MAEQQGFTNPASNPAGTGSTEQDRITGAPSGEPDPGVGMDHLSRTDAIQVQFPSLAGQPGVEVAERSSDVSKSVTKQHRKVFRLYTGGFDWSPDGFDHRPNFTATRQYMVEHGLRPVGDVAFVGAEPFDGSNTDLVYQVEAVPAAVATDAGTAHVVVSQDR